MDRKSKFTVIASIALAILIASCAKDGALTNPLVTPPHPNTVVALSMAYTRADTTFDRTVPFHDAANTLVRLDSIRFFFAQPFFLNDNADTVKKFPSKYVLFELSDGGTIHNLGEVDGHLNTLHVSLGLDSAANHAVPSADPLNNVGMYTGNTATGHWFLRLMGRYDSDSNGTLDTTFRYSCGTDALRLPFVVEVHTDANNGGDVVLPLSLNVDSLMNTINVAAGPNVGTVTPVTQRLMHNLASGISHLP